MSYQVQPTPTKGRRRTGLLVLGLILLIGGIGAGVGLYLVSGSQYEDAVKDLQRAPVGCDTEFNFTGTGTFIFYTETKGSVGDLRGDCENANRDYERDDDSRPRVTLTLVDGDGEEIDLDRSTDATYDKGGFVGSAVRELTIDEPAEYTLSVESEDDDFAIAVGRDPKDDADQLQMISFIVAGAGLLLGGLFIILGLRRRPVERATAAPFGPSAVGPTGYPTGPPAAPPFGQPGPPPTPAGPPPAPNDPFLPPPPPAGPPPPYG